MNPYKAFIRLRYSTFTTFSTRIFFLCLGFTSHIMSTNYPSIFNRMNLSSGMPALRYATGTQKITTSLPSCVSMMRLMNKYPKEKVGDDSSYLVMYHLWGLPSTHVLPFSFPLRFYFIKLMAISAPFFCDIVRLSGFSSPINFMYYSCVYYLYMSSTALFPCFLIPFLAVIWVNVTSTANFCMSRIKYFFLSPVLVVN